MSNDLAVPEDLGEAGMYIEAVQHWDTTDEERTAADERLLGAMFTPDISLEVAATVYAALDRLREE